MDSYLRLAVAEGVSPGLIPALLNPELNPEQILNDPPSDLPPAVRRRLQDPDLQRTAEAWLEAAAKADCTVLTPNDPRYPDQLQSVPLRPLVIFARGDLEQLNYNGLRLAVVGSRTPTPYGQAAARAFTDAIARAGIPLWSGLAMGIDATAHKACIRNEIPTVAVLAGGLDQIYPAQHEQLAERIVDTGGLLISELPPGHRPQRGHFPRRNRILACATHATLVVEAGLASGSLHTARFAVDAGGTVFAVPGPYTSPRSRGCHRLLSDGATLAASPEELLRDLGVEASMHAEDSTKSTLELQSSADEIAILASLELGPRPVDFVRREARLDDETFFKALFDLAERRVVQHLPGSMIALQKVGVRE